jgi:hypothetical protein
LRIYAGILDKLPEVKALVCWGETELPDDLKKDTRFHTYRDFLRLGKSVPNEKILTQMEK